MSSPTGVPLMKISIAQTNVNAFVDTGSELNALSLKFCNEHNIRFPRQIRKFCLADNSVFNSIGFIRIPVEYEDETKLLDFYVFSNCISDVILGRPGLRQFRVVLSFAAVTGNLLDEVTLSDRLDHAQKRHVVNLLREYEDIFGLNGTVVKGFDHSINLKCDAKPFISKSYKVPHKLESEMNLQIEEMVKNNIIRKSSSAWRSPSFFVKKKNGKWRFVIDFRKLNSLVEMDAFPIPNIDKVLTTFEGCDHFSVLDAASGYWQVTMKEDDRELTAFEAQGELYEFNVMPFGLCNAPATYQRMMTTILGTLKSCVAYIDDVIVASKGFDNHLCDLRLLFDRFRQYNLKLQPSKCNLAMTSVKYLGHIISKDGISPDPEKLKWLEQVDVPSNRKAADRFCGFVNYLSRYIPHLAHIVKPIFAAKSERKRFTWNDNCQAAFEAIKMKLLQDPVMLRFPDFNKPFILHVDASDVAMGACLSQDKGPIHFFSRTFNSAERNYSATDREFCALVNAVKYFRHIIFGYPTTVYTDHQAVVSLIHQRPPANGRHARYLNVLSEFTLNVMHIPGKSNVTADFLSRPVMHNDNLKMCAVDSNAIDNLISIYHNDGHFSVTKVRKALLSSGHWFPRMRARLQEFQKNCVVCARAKSYSNNNIPQGSLPSFPEVQPRQMVFVDIVGPLPTCKSGYRYIFTMIDAATKWLEAVPLTGIDSNRTINAFNNQWVLRHGPPARVHSDNGTNFRSARFCDFLSKCGIKQTFTTSYRPQGNSVIERQHRTLKDRLRTSLLQKSGQWTDHLQQAVFDINRTVSDVTGISPFRFLYGTDANAARDWPLSPKNFSSNLPVPKFVYLKVHDHGAVDPRRGEQLKVLMRLSDQLVRVSDGRVINLNNCFAVY